jgi:hypothetical protein
VSQQCDHNHDPEAIMHRLIAAAVADPLQFAAELATFANCPACSAAVVAQMTYQLAGFTIADQDGEDAEWVLCSHADFDPEVVSMRLALAADVDMAAAAINEAGGCQTCLVSLILTMTQAHTAVLNSTRVDWRSLVSRRLLEVLDAKAK